MIRASSPIPHATRKMLAPSGVGDARATPARLAEVDGPRLPVADRLERRPHAADAERPGEHVPGPARDDRQRRRPAGEGRGGLADRAVPTDRDDERRRPPRPRAPRRAASIEPGLDPRGQARPATGRPRRRPR